MRKQNSSQVSASCLEVVLFHNTFGNLVKYYIVTVLPCHSHKGFQIGQQIFTAGNFKSGWENGYEYSKPFVPIWE